MRRGCFARARAFFAHLSFPRHGASCGAKGCGTRAGGVRACRMSGPLRRMAALLLAVLLLPVQAAGAADAGRVTEDGISGAVRAARAAQDGTPGAPLVVSDEPLSDTELPEVEASAYIVMDAGSGQVLLQKEPDTRHFPASVTKIMTAALVLESCGDRLSEPVTASEAALAAVGPGSTMISLRPGETLTVEQLLYATVLESANDAANVLGEYVDGDLAAFVRRMNETAQSLGMTHTHFENPSGYHADRHYTTARDLAKAMQWALTVPGFLELLQMEEYTLPPTNQTAYARRFQTDNRLLLEGERHYDGILGGKSGWTPEARYTMIEAARRNGHTLIVVVLDCPTAGHRYGDCSVLLDYCFDHFLPYELDGASLELPELQVWSGGEQKGMVQLETSASLLLPEGCTPQDLRIETEIPRWYVYGVEFEASVTLTDMRTGREICTVSIEPESETLERLLGHMVSELKEPWDSRKLPGLVVYAALLAVLAFFIAYYARNIGRIRRSAARRSIGRMRRALPVREKPDVEDGPEQSDSTEEHTGRSVPKKLPVRRHGLHR